MSDTMLTKVFQGVMIVGFSLQIAASILLLYPLFTGQPVELFSKFNLSEGSIKLSRSPIEVQSSDKYPDITNMKSILEGVIEQSSRNSNGDLEKFETPNKITLKIYQTGDQKDPKNYRGTFVEEIRSDSEPDVDKMTLVDCRTGSYSVRSTIVPDEINFEETWETSGKLDSRLALGYRLACVPPSEKGLNFTTRWNSEDRGLGIEQIPDELLSDDE